ncbi:SAM-dependent DNA methyltransferase [candidate division WOR-3 bacterium]|nr:SAM-dependent DNA methyltransferase [candidate division WOR-3 bacterium]
MEEQVVSKKRVTDHAEVYTGEREVNAMLDLVKQETERIDSRFLEPACGTGNFMTEILKRKLYIVESRYKKSRLEYERYAVLAVSSIYGIDILEDNVVECRKRLFYIFDKKYSNLFKKKAKEGCRNAVKYILGKNIIWGDALSLKTVGDNPREIVFSEWSPFNGSMFKRRDFTFHELLPNKKKKQISLFSKPEQLLFSDSGEEVFIPKEIRSFRPIHFLKLGNERE